MFSSIVRLGVAISAAAVLSSCGGSSGQAETQQSTPEGLFTGTTTVTKTNSSTIPPTVTTSTGPNALVFAVYNGEMYSFFSNPATPTVITSAAEGTLTFSGGSMTSTNSIQVTLPNPPQSCSGTVLQNNPTTNPNVTTPSFDGAYNTGLNIAGTFTYPQAISQNLFQALTFNLNYNYGYQGVQSLATLAGSYSGTVGNSQCSETATFTFGPATVPSNTGNQLGVGSITGTGASGCAYTGTVSPLFKGNGYGAAINTGGYPCILPNTQFSGLIYLDSTNTNIYSFGFNGGRTDGLIFYGARL